MRSSSTTPCSSTSSSSSPCVTPRPARCYPLPSSARTRCSRHSARTRAKPPFASKERTRFRAALLAVSTISLLVDARCCGDVAAFKI
eukprot:scaffold50220_cov65-Phaeocystis_antarctica.AAC.1